MTRLCRLAKLQIEPFDEGSFVIPGEFGEVVLRWPVEGGTKEFTARDVLKRFADVMRGVAASGAKFATCLGVLDAIEQLGKVINREASGVEYAPSGFSDSPMPSEPILVDAAYVNAAARAKLERKNRRSQPGSLEGVLTLVDVAEHKLKLRLFQPEGKMVSGRFLAMMRERFVPLLGKGVRLHGTVKYQQNQPTSIEAVGIDSLSAV